IKHTLDALEHTLGFEFTAFGLVKRNSIKIEAYRGYHPFPEDLQEVPLDGSGITVKAVNTGDIICVKDVRKHQEYLPASLAIRSELAVPIKTKKRVVGVLNVEMEEVNGFDRADVRLLETLASHVAVALKRVEKGGKFVSLHELDELRDNFLAMAAHEINTPLTVIKSKAELLLKNSDLVLTAEQKEEIHRLLESVDRLARIVEDFRRISKFRGNTIQVEKKEHLLADTVEKALATFKDTLLEEGIHIIKAIQKPLWVRYDEDLLLQVIQNLLENAIDYAEEEVWIREWEEEGKAWLSIRDDGPGIPEEEQERIFDPF
ncbi:MAG: GAF domain-containing protein, partial [Candidatus Korarchaeota archaeon]|nr:GAF domain-containing protein [Candidatus Korarchaeota archaeon]NIU81897.1 GAF domain-containing protein [Candidatus Thorarchaeota archaeon]NIW12355.1 GAF domain-containing protein [Candidatus Thorarchaeota archaeon]NIW51147.1 GAF domain-containing protein [Candidatus Korarchaeota archaeon]